MKWLRTFTATLVVGFLLLIENPAYLGHQKAATIGNPVEGGIVATSEGLVRGVRIGETYVFKGIPYAAPPVGSLRWRPPRPARPWAGIREAKDYGSKCVQPNPNSLSGTEIIGSEDCLTLNIWTPSKSATSYLPVLFYIHGGGHVYGSSSDASGDTFFYDGQFLAEHGSAVVLTINYRLGVLGFIGHHTFSGETPYGGSGNYGYMDQIQALKWVQQNIRNFGGDPSRVMVFGLSAGASSTAVLLASPQAKGLFSSALLESSGGFTFSLQETEAKGEILAAKVGCTEPSRVASCLRSKDAKEIVAALTVSLQVGEGGVIFGPNVDNFVLPAPKLEMFRTGRHNHVPVIVGTAANEFSWVIFAVYPKPVVSDQEYRKAIVEYFGEPAASVILSEYPSKDYKSPQDALVAIFSDFVHTCPARQIARALAGSQSEPVRRYVFTHTWHQGPIRQFGAGHRFDDMFVWHSFPSSGEFAVFPDTEELKLSEVMGRYWTRFAASGNPNGGSEPEWKVYDPRMDNYLGFDTPITANSKWRTAQCDFWDQYLYH